MSRSFRKAPVQAVSSQPSDKRDKQDAHQAQRAHFRTDLHSAPSVESLQFDERRFAHSDAQHFSKRGKERVRVSAKRGEHGIRILTHSPELPTDRAAKKVLAK